MMTMNIEEKLHNGRKNTNDVASIIIIIMVKYAKENFNSIMCYSTNTIPLTHHYND